MHGPPEKRKPLAAKNKGASKSSARRPELCRILNLVEEDIHAKRCTEAQERLKEVGKTYSIAPSSPEAYRYHYLRGLAFFWQGDQLSAWEETDQALRIFNRVHRLPLLPKPENLPNFVAKNLKQLRAIEVALLEGLESHNLGDDGQKREVLERRIFEISASLENLNPLAKLHQLAGSILRHLGKPSDALEHLEWAATGFRLSRDWAALAETLNRITPVYLSRGELQTAIQILEQARHYSLIAKDRYFEMIIRSNLALCQLLAGSWRPACSSLPEILAETKKANDLPRYTTTLLLWGSANLLRGRLNESRKAFVEAQRISTEKKLMGVLQHSHEYLAELCMAEGHLEEAEIHLKKVLEISQQVSPQGQTVAEAWQKLGELHLARKEYSQALKAFTVCRDYLSRRPEKLVEGALWRGMGIGHIGLEQLRPAQNGFKRAIDIFESCGNEWELAKTAVLAAESGAFAPAEIQSKIIRAKEIFKKLEHSTWRKRAQTVLEHFEFSGADTPFRLAHQLVEKEQIAKALADAGGNISVAAKKLGLLRQTLQYKIKRYKIEV